MILRPMPLSADVAIALINSSIAIPEEESETVFGMLALGRPIHMAAC